MWKLITGLFSNLALFAAKLLDYLSEKRLVDLGRLQERDEQAQQERENARIAAEVDAAPTPRDRARILDGLRQPSD